MHDRCGLWLPIRQLCVINTLRLEQNDCRFEEDIFECFPFKKCLNFEYNFIEISSSASKSAMIQVINGLMALDTKPLPETILTKNRYWSPWLVGYNIRQFNTLLWRQNVRLFADDTFKCMFLNGHVKISIQIPLKFVPKGSN